MKKIVTKEKFNIEVEKEIDFLGYFNYLKGPEAKAQALKNVSEKFVVEGSPEAKALAET